MTHHVPSRFSSIKTRELSAKPISGPMWLIETANWSVRVGPTCSSPGSCPVLAWVESEEPTVAYTESSLHYWNQVKCPSRSHWRPSPSHLLWITQKGKIHRADCGQDYQEVSGSVLSSQMKRKKKAGTPGTWQGGPRGSSLGGQEVAIFQHRTETSYDSASAIVPGLVGSAGL